MSAIAVALRYSRSIPHLFLREICGADELMITDTSTGCALGLLDRLLDGQRAKDHPSLSAAQLTTADRDSLLAQLYHSLYGDRIESTVTCQFCAAKFDMDFSLAGLQRHLDENRSIDGVIPLEDGSFRLDQACRFRLPTGEDELATVGLPAAAAGLLLLARCLLEGSPEEHGERVQQAMAEIAPVIQSDMQTFCAECAKEQTLFFDIQTFLLGRLLNDQKQTIRDTHRLASVYHWPSTEILSIPRRLRRMYCHQIESER